MMKKNLLIVLVMIFGYFLHYWLLDKIPPAKDTSFYIPRVISAFFSTANIFLLYLVTRKISKNIKLSIITALIYSLLPWVFEESRVISQPSNSLFIILIGYLLIRYFPQKLFKIIILFGILGSLYYVYPQLWIFRIPENFSLNLKNFLTNFLILTSPEFLFFKNITHWWIGVRDVGVIYLSFLPFFLIGLYKVIQAKHKEPILWLIFITIISALSPFFPEGREFFLITPVLAFCMSKGIIMTFSYGKFSKILVIILLSFLLYEVAGHYHFYTVHQPEQIINNFHQINEVY